MPSPVSTGKVRIVARTLLAAGLPVRAVVRDADKGRPWVERGCEVAIASIADADGLTKAFSGADGVFLMTPPDFDPEPGFPIIKTHEAIAAGQDPIFTAQPARGASPCPRSVRRWRNSTCSTIPR